MSALLERLRSGDAALRAAACRDAAGDPAGALHAEALAAALRDPEPRVASAAGEALVALARGGSGDVIVPLLRAALRARASRVAAALALARLEPPEPALLPALVEALAAPGGDLRWRAARALVDMGRLHGEVTRVLLGLVRDGAPAVRRMAVFALRELAPDLPAAALALVEASRASEPGLRRAALTAMAGLLAPPAAVRERLDEALREPDPIAAELAQLALDRLGAAAQSAKEQA